MLRTCIMMFITSIISAVITTIAIVLFLIKVDYFYSFYSMKGTVDRLDTANRLLLSEIGQLRYDLEKITINCPHNKDK